MDGGGLGQPVVDDEADAVALVGLDERAGHRAVEAPDVEELAGQKLALHDLRNEVELLGPVDHLPGQAG